MKFDTGRRRSSAGFIFALGAAALATVPDAVTAAPAVGSIFEGYSFGRRGSESSIPAPQADIAPHEQPIRQVLRRASAFASSTPSEADHASSAKLFPKRSMARVLHARQGGCLDSSANEDDINTLLWDGGADVKIALCPGAVITLNGPISFSNPNQEIYTVGYPTDDTRAKLVVGGQYQEVAIWNNCDRCTNTAVRNIQIDGSRQTLGRYGNSGLIEMGGNAKYQVVDGCKISDPRGWTAIHVAEGYRDSCSDQYITNNEIGPCGTAPNTAKQFRVVMTQLREFMATPKRLLKKRQVSAPGQWADGISLACRNSTVTGNTITGATDGGIVLFGAPGSTITGNTIIAKGNTLLGGINLVDHGPFNGDYSGTVVSGNTIVADDAMIKIGIAVGLLAWGDYNSSDYRTTGGIITDNNFVANGNGTGYFGYGTAVGGNNGAVVSGNNYDEALFGGTTSYACQSGKTPTPQASIWDPYTTSGGSYQPGVTNLVDFNFLICTMPCQYDSSCGANMTLTKNVATVNTTASTTSWSTSTVPGTVIRTPSATTSTSTTSSTLIASSTGVNGTTTGGTSTTGRSTTSGGTSTTGLSTTSGLTSTGLTGSITSSTSTGVTTSNQSTSLSGGSTSTTRTSTTSATSLASTGVSSTGASSSTSTGLSSATSTTGSATGTTTGTSKISSTTSKASTTSTTSKASTTSTTSKASTTSSKPTTTTTTSRLTSTSRATSTSTTSKPTTTLKTSTTTKATTTSTKPSTSTSTRPATTSTSKSVGLALGRGNGVILLPSTSKKTTTSSKPASTAGANKATSTTSSRPTSTSKASTTTTKTTSKATTTSKTSSKATTTSKAATTTAKTTSTTKSTGVFSSSSTRANMAATTTAPLARTRGGLKRSLDADVTAPRPLQRPRKAAWEEVEEIEEQLRMYRQSLLRSRSQSDMDQVARLEHKLMVYRDWILPGAVRTPTAKRSLIDEEGFDKRDTLADDAYWS